MNGVIFQSWMSYRFRTMHKPSRGRSHANVSVSPGPLCIPLLRVIVLAGPRYRGALPGIESTAQRHRVYSTAPSLIYESTARRVYLPGLSTPTPTGEQTAERRKHKARSLTLGYSPLRTCGNIRACRHELLQTSTHSKAVPCAHQLTACF